MNLLSDAFLLLSTASVGGFFSDLLKLIIVVIVLGVVLAWLFSGANSPRRPSTPPRQGETLDSLSADLSYPRSRVGTLEAQVGEQTGWSSLSSRISDLEDRLDDLKRPGDGDADDDEPEER